MPFHFDRDVNEISTDEGSYAQNVQASITIVEAYLNKLREAGVYDDSAIIVLADHGYPGSEETDGLLGRSNPLLLIKGFGEKHEMKISEQPLSHADLIGMYPRLLAGEKTDRLFDIPGGDKRKRRCLSFDFINPKFMREYIQKGYASDFDAMEYTGVDYVMH